MDEPVVEIIIKPDGKVVMEGMGFEGPACEAAMRKLQDALGQTESEQRTSDYYRESKVKATY
jgi:hypothetical protein